MSKLRQNLVNSALAWESSFGNAPQITGVLAEFDAAILVGCSVKDYSLLMQKMTAVNKGYDFMFNEKCYQVKGNRPSGKSGSRVTLVQKPKNYEWDFLVWVLYDKKYKIQEAWLWDVSEYKHTLGSVKRISPSHMREGKSLFKPNSKKL